MSKHNLGVMYNVKRKKMAKGGAVNESAKTEHRPSIDERDKDAAMVSRNEHIKASSQDHVLDQPTVKQARANDSRRIQPIKHPRMVASDIVQSRLRDEEDHLMESAKVNDGPQKQPAKALDEVGADRQGPDVEALHMKMMAEGGEIDDSLDHEIEEEHHDSIAAAIMAKRKRMADGGILSHDSIYSDDSDQVDLSRNAQEDANEEDQLSFNALRKENYSESEGLDQLDQPEDSNLMGDDREDAESDKHDKVEIMRRRMNAKRQFKAK